jgi:hypothetical protein
VPRHSASHRLVTTRTLHLTKIRNCKRSCTQSMIMSARQVCLVGSRHYSAFGAHGADSYVNFAHFNTLEECCRHLKDSEGKCNSESCAGTESNSPRPLNICLDHTMNSVAGPVLQVAGLLGWR